MTPRRTPATRHSTPDASQPGGAARLRPHEVLLLASTAIRLEQHDGTPPDIRSARDPAGDPALVAAIAELHPDTERRAQLAEQVRVIGEELPTWLAALGSARVVDAVDVGSDWLLDRFAIEVHLGDEDRFTVAVRIDHRRGTVVSDADLMDTDVVGLLRGATVVGGAHPSRYRSVSPADVRAKLEQALTTPRPPVGVGPTTEWEPLRPLLWWLVRLMPAGGAGYDDESLDDMHASARSTDAGGQHRSTRRASYARTDPDSCEALELRLGLGMRSRTFGSQLLHEVTELVGGPAALDMLDAEPLPDEPFDPTGVPADIRPAVDEVLDLCDRACDQFFDVEVRTATRRLLHRVATDGAAAFRRRGSTHTAAAARVWVVAMRNNLLGKYAVRANDLTAYLAVSGSPSGRATGLLRAAGMASPRDAPQFDAAFLTGRRRAELIKVRDSLRRQPVYRLRVTLDGFEPPIERTVEVLGYETFGHLHDVLQVAFGWDGSHLAQFELDERIVARTDGLRVDPPWGGVDDRHPHDAWGRPLVDHVEEWDDEDDDDEPMGEMDSLVLAPVLESAGTLRYRYDLGDDWVHTITVESATTLGETADVLPRLVSAARATPPDDLGGVGIYKCVLDVLGTDEEYQVQALCDAVRTPVLPGTFDPYRPDPEAVPVEAIRAALRPLAT